MRLLKEVRVKVVQGFRRDIGDRQLSELARQGELDGLCSLVLYLISALCLSFYLYHSLSPYRAAQMGGYGLLYSLGVDEAGFFKKPTKPKTQSTDTTGEEPDG